MGISNKEYCLEAINKLYDSQLLDDFDDTIDVTTQRKKKNRDHRKHKFRLSEKGKEIAKLLIEIDEYQKNYFRLEQGIGEKIPHKSRKEIKETRRYDSGWKDKEIEFYFTYRSNALDLIDLIDKNFIGIVLVRYSKIIDDTFIMLNKDAKKILNDIIIKVFERRIRYVLDKYKIYEESAKARIIENYRNPIYQKPQYEEKYESGIQGRLPHFMDIVNFSIIKLFHNRFQKKLRK